MSATRLATGPGLQRVTVKADYLTLTILNCAPGEEPGLEMDGPQDVTGKVRADRDGGTWRLTWPAGSGGGSGGVFIGNGGTQVNSFTGGGVHIGRMSGGGRVVVNGVDVTDYVRQQSGQGAGGGELTAVLRVPAGTEVSAEVNAGSVTARGSFAALRAVTQSADVDCSAAVVGSLDASTQSGDVEAGATGPAMIATMSGDIEVTGARGAVQAQAMSGDVEVHVTESVMVNARSMSGDVRVTKASGTSPTVTASSMSGRVRQP
jgi:Putative adhesin